MAEGAMRKLGRRPIRGGSSLAPKRTAAVSALARLILVDRRLHRGARLVAGAHVFRLGVVIAPLPRFARVALEVRMDIARHQLVALFGRLPVRPVVGKQQYAAEAAVRAAPQPLEMADAVVRCADAGDARRR